METLIMVKTGDRPATLTINGELEATVPPDGEQYFTLSEGQSFVIADVTEG